MKVLMVSKYAEPSPKGSNAAVFDQARLLSLTNRCVVEILTWPFEDGWTGPTPSWQQGNSRDHIPYVGIQRQGIQYHVIDLPTYLRDRVLTESEWQTAVAFGMRLLEQTAPSILHLQHWRGLWWMLEAAQRLAIPTVYTAHDWGIPCLRTILVTGHGQICDGLVTLEKCATCIFAGRNLLGKANELMAKTGPGGYLLQEAYARMPDRFLAQGAVRTSLRDRLKLNIDRASRVISALDALTIPNRFGSTFFSQFGIPGDRIHVLPWYSDGRLQSGEVARTADHGLTLGYIGRIAPEKGVHILLEALSLVDGSKPVNLQIAGAIDNAYAKELRRRYADVAGEHAVKWLGWVTTDDRSAFFSKVDLVILPSLAMDNTPLTMLEAFRHSRPVVASDVATFREMITDQNNGFLFPAGDSRALCNVIERVVDTPGDLERLRKEMPRVMTGEEYSARLLAIYDSLGIP